jgi:hypothetical protein
MLHNSLLIRDRLREANQDPLRRDRRAPHRRLKVDPDAVAHDSELALTGPWRVSTDGTLPGMETARDDLAEALTACGTTIIETGARQIVLTAGPDAPRSGFRRIGEADSVGIRSATTAGLWGGIVDLEQTIALRRAPILPLGETVREPRWPVQISQAPMGANYLVPDLSEDYLSDDAFRLMAHYGLTGMTIYGDWLLYVRSDRHPELGHPEADRHIATLQEATERAVRFGIRLYFVAVSPKLAEDHPAFVREPALRGARIAAGLRSGDAPIHNLCSTSPESLALHRETFAALFESVPDLGGLILIIGGESYYHCYMRPDRTGLPEGQRTNCPRCAERTPEAVVAGLLDATASAVHEVAPDVPVMAWPYSAFVWSSDPDQTALIHHLPDGVSLLTEIDKDAWVSKQGYEKHIWDYSVDFAGPSDRIRHQAALVHERGHDLYVKSETALGLECIQVPYVPALHRLGEKWMHVRELAPAGVLQSWMFFGMWGSRAEELGWWTNWRPDVPLEGVLRQMAERDFGAHADAALAAWRAMSEAAGHLPFIATYFHGPEFIGPCHPLLFASAERVPDVFYAALYYLQENEATFGTVAKEIRHALVTNDIPAAFPGHRLHVTTDASPWEIVDREYAAAVAAAHEVYTRLRNAATAAGADPGSELGDEAGLVEFLYRTWQTTLHTYRFLHARRRWEEDADPSARDQMREIGQAELENARAARHLYVDHPWLNLRLRLDGDYPDSLSILDVKLALLEDSLVRISADQTFPLHTRSAGDGI